MRPAKLHTQERHNIARAYNTGARPCELAEDHGVTPAYVIATANWFECRLAEREAKAAAQRTREFRFERPVVRSEPCITIREMRSGARAVTNSETGISLPYVSILHKNRPAKRR